MAVGINASPAEIDSYLQDIGISKVNEDYGNREVTFDLFYRWWSNKEEDDNNSQFRK